MKSSNKRSLITSLILIATAIAFIASPESAMSVVFRIVGALILLWEIFDIYSSVRYLGGIRMVPFILLSDIFVIVCAVVLLINPMGAIRLLSIAIGVFLLVSSAITLFKRFSSPIGIGFSGTLVTVVSLLLGLWLVISPFDITRLTSIFIGVAILLRGLGMLLSAIDDKDNGDGYDDNDYITDDFVDKSDYK